MSATSERVPFVEARFLEDIRKGSEEMGAPYDEEAVRGVINAYGDLMYDAAIQMRGSSRAGVPLLFRVITSTQADTIDIALGRGWLHPDDPLVVLAAAARGHFDGLPFELPEFSVDRGCDAVFMYLGGVRPAGEVLGVPGMPAAIRAHGDEFRARGLDQVVVVHFQFTRQRVSLFFLAQGPLSRKALDDLVALCGAPPPSDAAYRDIIGVLRDSGYYFTVVMDYNTGKIVKIELHLLFPVKLPDDMQIPEVGENLATFWDIPSYESEDSDVLSYCFGDTSSGEVLALRGYCGGLRSLLRHWNVVDA